jgi:hypothetical protein
MAWLTLLEDGGAVDLDDRVLVFVLFVVGHDVREVAPLSERHKTIGGLGIDNNSALGYGLASLSCPLGLPAAGWLSPLVTLARRGQLDVGAKLRETPTASRDPRQSWQASPKRSSHHPHRPRTKLPPPGFTHDTTSPHRRHHRKRSTTQPKSVN